MRKWLVFVFLILLASNGFCADKTLKLILVDETGSMGVRQGEASKDLNSMLRKFSESDQPIVLARFNSCKYEYEYGSDKDGVPNVATNKHVKEVTNYKPDCNTPLLDSIAKLIQDGQKISGNYSKIEVYIFTDGEENESKLFNETSLKELIEKSGFVVNYIAIKLDPNHNEAWLGGQRSGLIEVSLNSGGSVISSDVGVVFTSFMDNENK